MNINPTEYYNKFNFITIPLLPNSKRPYLKNWQYIQQSKKIQFNDNIGVITGKISNIIVIDIDKDGLSTWRSWIKKYGKIDTPVNKTGDGYHYFFKYDKDIKNKIKIKVNDKKIGIDIYTDNKQVVIPPSIHPNKKKYKWTKSLEKYPIINIPNWLKQKIM